jgi:hypothetical protein
VITRRLPELVGVLALLLCVTVPAIAQTNDPSPRAQLNCQLRGGAWEPCLLRLDADGMGWQLTIGNQPKIQFLHDGRGHVRMRDGAHGWRTVEARWLADASLCWDGVCARGEIPLD